MQIEIQEKMKPGIIKTAAIFSLIFGLATIFAGGSVIFDLFGMREKEGNYVLFVVWANFICGFLYIISSIGFFKRRKWTFGMLSLAFLILIATFLSLAIWILEGNIYETKTIMAMTFRTLITLALWLVARHMK